MKNESDVVSFSLQEPVQKTWTLKIWWGERGPGNVETVRVQNYVRAVIKAHNALTLRGRKVDEGGSRGRVGHLRAPDRESFKERESNARRSRPPNMYRMRVTTIEVAYLNRFLSYLVHELAVGVAQNWKLTTEIENCYNRVFTDLRPTFRDLVL